MKMNVVLYLDNNLFLPQCFKMCLHLRKAYNIIEHMLILASAQA